ncbi:MAG: ABC transporter ATP-binding protein [Alphaproteobacteria bacterium]|nr:ABC transporter ATP-binding protein [Alphaproteobacteria bacterium]
MRWSAPDRRDTVASRLPEDSTDVTRRRAGGRSLVQRLVRTEVRPHVGRLTIAALCMAISAGATAGYAWLMEPVLNEIFVARNRDLLVLVTALVVGLFVVKGIAGFAETVLLNHVGQRIVADLQARLYAHLVRLDLPFFHATPSGELVARFTNDANFVRAAVSTALTGLVKDTLTVIALVALMFYQDWLLASVSFFAFPLALAPIVRIGRRTRRASSRAYDTVGRFSAFLAETIQGIRTIRAYGMETRESARAAALSDELFQRITKALRVKAIASPIMETLGGLAIAVVVLYGGWQVIGGATTPGAFFSFITALLLAYQPLKSIANLNAHLQEGLAAAERLFALLDRAPAIAERADARPLRVARGVVRFEDVRFAYGDRPALKGVTFEVPAGRTVALVGPSGAGKSTVLNLIPRFYDADRGAVTIDGQDVRGMTLASLRGAIALVSQEASLFNDTVRANILYGRPGAGESEVEAAVRAAAAHDFIMALPAGYDTVVGEQGAALSGGQRQRIAIARAMLRDAPILLLDEATSALDSESEQAVRAALDRLRTGRTTIVIAHRLATVLGADAILVMDGGRIVERGTHAELIARGGVYARLYARDLRDIEDDGRAIARAGA